jgi:hypothetical protein
MCDVNGKFVAVVLESQGGGAFTVFPIDKPGRMDIGHPKVTGHKSNVLDIKWNPFNENIIASASEDCCVKIWEIPDEGLADNLSDPVVSLEGHNRKVGCIAWHPTAADIIVSAGADSRLVVWNVQTEDALFEVDLGGDILIYCISWNYNGSLLAATSKDKKLRVVDPRKGDIISEIECHGGSKPSQVAFCGTLNFLFTTGFSRSNERQLSVWDLNKLDKPLSTMNIDSSNGVMFIYYDEGTKMVYLVGKGDSIIRYYELFPESPYVQYLNMYNTSNPQRSCGCMPKRYLSHSECEVARFYKLHNKGMIEPVTMTVPRKSGMFQDDIYPPCAAGEPSLSADEWAAGQDKPPALVNITKDGLGSVVGGAAISLAIAKSGSGKLSKQSSYSSTGSSGALNSRQSPEREITLTSSANVSIFYAKGMNTLQWGHKLDHNNICNIET